MRAISLLVVILGVLLGTGCSPTAPATTPPTTATPTSSAVVSTPTPTSTTAVTTTTTLDRVGEIEAILQDLEQRRLDALYRGDREGFSALFANEGYLERSLGAFDLAEFHGAPLAEIDLQEILFDGVNCIAALRTLRRVDTDQVADPAIAVAERTSQGWGISYVGEGWACEGSHPFGS